NEYNYEIKREFIQVSDKVILLADKSKYKKKSLLRICGLDEVDILVSNAEVSL
ncbi:DeoR/GlpR transcriptional regulator, partial [Vibrio mimicus]